MSPDLLSTPPDNLRTFAMTDTRTHGIPDDATTASTLPWPVAALALIAVTVTALARRNGLAPVAN